MSAAFQAFLRRLVRKGRLEVETADGVVETFGDGAGRRSASNFSIARRNGDLMLNPALALGELYMDGRLVVTKGDLYDLLELARAISPNWKVSPGPRR